MPNLDAPSMAERIEAFDWERTSLGAIDSWPASLETAVGIMLGASSPVAIYWGPELILLYNDAFGALIGSKHPAGLGRPGKGVFPELWSQIGPEFETVISGRGSVLVRDELRPIERKGRDGEAWFDYSLNPIPKGDGSIGGVLNLAVETTDKHRIEQALRASEERYRLLFENMGEGFALAEMIWDEEGRPLDWRYLDVNQAWTQTGLPLSSVVGRRAREVNPQLETCWIEAYGRVVKTGRPIRFEGYAAGLGKWFSTFAFKHSDNRFAVLFFDITERRAAEQQRAQELDAMTRLRELGALFAREGELEPVLTEVVDAAIAITGAELGTIQLLDGQSHKLQIVAQRGFPSWWVDFWNEAAELGAVCGAVLERRERVIVEDIEKHARYAGTPALDIQRKAGVRAMQATPLVGRSGKPLGVFSTHYLSPSRPNEAALRRLDLLARQASDIIERSQAEEALRDLNATLEERVAKRTAEVEELADRLRALNTELGRAEQRERRRLAVILHDHIQQLIVGARIQLDWLKQQEDPQRRQAAIQGINGILTEALSASRDLTMDLSPPILHDVGLVGALNWLARRMRDKQHFTVRLRGDNRAECAPESVRLLLFECTRELLFNAVKHSGVREAEVVLTCDDEDQVHLSVADRGQGFDPEDVVGPSGGDASFGLFSIQQRLAHVGGRMEIKSARGEGTRITLHVPTEGPRVANDRSSSSTHHPGGAASTRKKNDVIEVLLVDDHKVLREGLAELLRFEADMEVVAQASDASQAIELAGWLEPDVVVMDVNLGGTDGVEATRRILATRPEIKVIGLTMHVESEIAMAMREAGAVAHLTKSAPSSELIAAIRACGA